MELIYCEGFFMVDDPIWLDTGKSYRRHKVSLILKVYFRDGKMRDEVRQDYKPRLAVFEAKLSWSPTQKHTYEMWVEALLVFHTQT